MIDRTFAPDLELALDEAALATWHDAWCWKTGADVTPLLVTLFGDVFYCDRTETVFWLDTGAGSVSKVAATKREFEQALRSEKSDLWLLPALVNHLRAAGKSLDPGQCYHLITAPIFREGKYEVDNIAPVSVVEHFRLSADLHRQIAELPDGAKVRFKTLS
jgi:hypothetical protein